jgi:RHS repeat-associated protein
MRSSRMAVVTGVVFALIATCAHVPAQAAKPDGPGWPTATRLKSVPGKAVPARPRQPDKAAQGAQTAAPPVTWPKPGSVEVTLSRASVQSARAADLPVWVKPDAAKGPDRVRVEVLDQPAAQRAGVRGVMFRVQRADGSPDPGPVTVDVDYSGFRHAFGGDYATRLALVRLPACASTTPHRAECLTGTVVKAQNDVRTGRIRGDVTASSAKSDAVYALTATPNGSAGNFKPTSLSPSAMWEVGLQSGDFSWSYPLELPPVPGPEPAVALSYSSGAIDGRTTSTNNQASWVGDGFDFQPGYIERQYTSCSADMTGGNNGVATADLCYASANAVVALPGVAGELVWDAGKRIWRAEEDDGWRVDQLFGAANGDNDGEHWRLTSADGTQYFFGRAAAAKSAWTVPVYGNQPGEPCNAASFGASWCQQAYRWMLDYVIDRHGDVITYSYDTETNHYGREGNASLATPYVRAGQLARIDYGLREGQTDPIARVVFTPADRCIPSSPCQRSQTADWPDVPWDQQCDGGVCTGRHSPVFFGTRRLAKITSQVRDGTGFSDVDSWTLTHLFPATGDATDPSLWLESIVHTGHTGGTASEPEVNFDGVLQPNRVESGDGEPSMNRWRVGRVNTETGGQIQVSYAPAGCTPGALPAADTNGRPCFPAWWTPQGATESKLGWFHKYLVTEVRERDLVGGAPDDVTSYEYVGDAAWHHDDAELVPQELKTWGQWRGYQTMKVRTGDPAGPRTLVEHRFFRGMFGDLKADGTRKTDKLGTQNDEPVLRGFAQEEITYNGDGGPEISREFHEPVIIGPNAVRRRASGDLSAYATDTRRTYTRIALADGGFRETEELRKFDEYGIEVELDDRGDLSTPDDDKCTTTSYTPNLQAWIIGLSHRIEAVSARCGTAVSRPADVLSDIRVYYDGSDVVGAAPVKGDATRVEELSSWGANGGIYTTTERAEFDVHGRDVKQIDARGNITTTSYTPAVGGPTTETRVTNALGHEETTHFALATGSPVLMVDANGKQTELAYDPLGRLVRAWGPGRSTTDTPDAEFEYVLRKDGPAAVTTKTLLGNGTYATGYALFDGLLRPRQTQAQAPGGGRIVTDTFYDSHGELAKTNSSYHNTDPPGTTLLAVDDNLVPAQTVVRYDGAGREVTEILMVEGVEKWRTTTSYGGNWVREDPPADDTPTTRLFDADGKVTELRQHKNATEFDTTRYTYTKADQLSTVTDPAGNVWRHHYDLRGREIQVDDPDKGTATMTYDDEDLLLSTTDSRGRTITRTYDPLGRPTATHEGTTKLAELTYDSLGKGLPVASIRYVNGNAYRSEVTGYDDRGRATGTAVTIPATEGKLAGRYESTSTHNAAGQVVSATLPGAGGLPAETLEYGYDDLGLPASLAGLAKYVELTAHNNLADISEYILGGEDGKRLQQSFEYETGTRRTTVARTRDEVADTPVVERGFTYDAAGNVRKLVTSARDRATDTQCFDIDYLQRMTEAWTADDDCAARPSLDKLGGPAPYWHSYTFDKAGNRLTEKWHAASGDTNRAYTYPAPGSPQPHTLRSVTTTDPAGTRTDNYGYDSDGNTTSRPGQTLTWNSEGSLEFVVSGAETTSYLYNATGDRLIRREPGATTLYLGSMELRLDTRTDNVVGTRYYTFHDSTVAVRTPTSLSWTFDDQHGTGETAVNAATQEITHQLHLPYGAPRGSSPSSWPGERGFVGGNEDRSTGLTHLGAREYDPLTGRFISVDPIIDVDDPQQMHGYAYANNSPATFTDPDGLKAKKAKKSSSAKSAKSTKKTSAKSKTTASKKSASSAKKKPKPDPRLVAKKDEELRKKIVKIAEKEYKKVEALKKKYAKDPAKLQKELTKLYDKYFKDLGKELGAKKLREMFGLGKGNNSKNTAWCAVFVSWVLVKAGVKPKDLPSKNAAWATNWGKNKGKHADPRPGDIVVFGKPGKNDGLGQSGHVEIVTKVHKNGKITTVGGNRGPGHLKQQTFDPKGAIAGDDNVGIYGYISPPVYVDGYPGVQGNHPWK